MGSIARLGNSSFFTVAGGKIMLKKTCETEELMKRLRQGNNGYTNRERECVFVCVR